MNNFNLKNFKHIHFVGIGGISMYLLAIYCKDLGIEVSGSDINSSKYIKICKDKGINVSVGHKRKNILGADLVVHTSAVNRNNVEVVEAIKKQIMVIDRADLLSHICKNYKCVIGVSGTHGKTTTCSMIYHILRESGKSVSCHIGADIIGARFNPEDDYLVVECCEYNRSFLKFNCDIAVVLNIDNDHLDCYGNMYNLRNAFRMFLKNAGTRFIFANRTTSCIKNKAIRVKPARIIDNNKFVIDENEYILSNAYGEHNINNATVAVKVCESLGISYSKIYKALTTFNLAGRRCQKLGKINQADVITDYAHHPREIECLYNAVRSKYQNVHMVFQPHTYSRTKILLHDFVKVFQDIKNIVIFKEYPARESKNQGYSAKYLSEQIDSSVYIKNFRNLKKFIKQIDVNQNDCVVFVGAGDINLLVEKMINKFV